MVAFSNEQTNENAQYSYNVLVKDEAKKKQWNKEL